VGGRFVETNDDGIILIKNSKKSIKTKMYLKDETSCNFWYWMKQSKIITKSNLSKKYQTLQVLLWPKTITIII